MMSFLDIPMLHLIVYGLASLVLFQLIIVLVSEVVLRVHRRFPRLRGHLDIVLELEDMFVDGYNGYGYLVLGVAVIGYGNAVMLRNDDYKTAIYLTVLNMLGFLSYMFAMLRRRGFMRNCFVIVTFTTHLAIMAICSLRFILPPAMFIIISFLYVILMITYTIYKGYVNVVHERTEREKRFHNFIDIDTYMAVAMSIFLMGAKLLWPDFEKDYPGTAEWLRVYAFVVFWTSMAARLLKQGLFYAFHLFIGMVAAISMVLTLLWHRHLAGCEILILCFCFILFFVSVNPFS